MTTVAGTELGTSRTALRRIAVSGVVQGAVSLAVSLAVLPLVLSRLGASIYGAWVALSAVVAVAALVNAGVQTEAARRMGKALGGGRTAEADSIAAHAATVVGSIGLPLTLVAVAAAPAIIGVLLPHGVPGCSRLEVEAVLASTLALTFATLVLSAHFAVLAGVQRADVTAWSQLIAVLANAGLLVAGILVGWGIWSFVLAQAGALGASATYQFVRRRQLLPGTRFRFVRMGVAEATSYLSLSGLALLSQVSEVFDSQLDKLVLAGVVGPAAVAAFNIGIQFSAQAKVIAVLPLNPILAATAELRGRDRQQLIVTQRKLMKLGSVAAVLALGGVFMFGPSFVGLWLGTKYAAAGEVTRYYAVAVLANLIVAPLAFQAFGEGRHWIAAASSAANILVNFVGTLVLTLNIGLMGAVYGSIAGNVTGAVVLILLAWRRLDHWIWPPISGAAPIVALAAGFAILRIHLSSWPVLGVTAAGFLAVGAVVALSLEGFRPSELRRALG